MEKPGALAGRIRGAGRASALALRRLLLLLLEVHAPELGLDLAEHAFGEQVGAHTEQELALQVAELEGGLDFWETEERFGFPGSPPWPVRRTMAVVIS